MESNGQRGAARSVEAVPHIWHAMPASVFVAASAQRDRVAPAHYDGGMTPEEPPKGQPLTSKERRELARLMWKCRSMSDPNIRSGIVSDLESEINTSITRNRSDDLADIRHIIDACEYFNCFTSLIDSMKFFEQDAPSMRAVEKFLQGR